MSQILWFSSAIGAYRKQVSILEKLPTATNVHKIKTKVQKNYSFTLIFIWQYSLNNQITLKYCAILTHTFVCCCCFFLHPTHQHQILRRPTKAKNICPRRRTSERENTSPILDYQFKISSSSRSHRLMLLIVRKCSLSRTLSDYTIHPKKTLSPIVYTFTHR